MVALNGCLYHLDCLAHTTYAFAMYMWSGLTKMCKMLSKNGPFFRPLMFYLKIVFEMIYM